MFRLGFAEHIADAAVILVDAGFGPYLIRAAGRGLLDGAKDLLFVANTRRCRRKPDRKGGPNRSVSGLRFDRMVRAMSPSSQQPPKTSGS